MKAWPRYALIAGIILYTLTKVWVLFGYHNIIWDEAVYLTMGKFLASMGAQGFWEILRPPVWPVVLSALHLTGVPVFFGALITNAAPVVAAVLLARLLREHVHEGIAVGTGLLILFADTWFSWSTMLLTGVLAGTLIIASCYAYAKGKPFLAALLGALAFLTRFPAGIVLATLGIAYVWNATKEWRTGRWGAQSKHLLIYACTAVSITGVWILLNWFAWQAETSAWWHAAFRPLLMGSGNVIFDNLWLYDASTRYYFTHLLTFLPVTLLGVVGLFRIRKHTELVPLILTGILALVFFTWLPHNEWRFIIIALPGLLVLAALGLDAIATLPVRGAQWAAIALIAMNLAGLMVVDYQYLKDKPREELEITAYYRWLKENPVEGAIIVTDPVVAYYAPNQAIPVYFDVALLARTLPREHAAVAFVPHHFPCHKDDRSCQLLITRVVDDLTSYEKLVYEQSYGGGDFYIFSNAHWFTELPNTRLRDFYGLASAVSLSKHPQDRMPVTIILEDFPSLDDNGTAIWYEDRYNAMYMLMEGYPATAAVIPTHLERLAVLRPETLLELQQFSIAQNGYDHSSLPGRPQSSEIGEGKHIIEEHLRITPTVFIPPQYAADDETVSALNEHEFHTYISTFGDPVTVRQIRLDQTTTLIINWGENIHKPTEDVLNDLEGLARYHDYGLLSVYYFQYDDAQREAFARLLTQIQETYLLMDAEELTRWLLAREQSNISISRNHITVAGEAEGLTLLFRKSGNYTLETAVSVYAKNVAAGNLTVCIDFCQTVPSHHFFENISPMVILPDVGGR